MTVSTTVSQIEYAGDGLVVAFPTTFKFLANGDVTVVLRDSAGVETPLTETTHYTLTGALADLGGTVTMITAPASNEVLVLKRVTAKTQGIDYVENDPFPAETHELGLDRLTMIAQESGNGIDRAIAAPISDTNPDMELPIASARANKYVSFDANGNAITTSGTGGGDTALRTDLASLTNAGLGSNLIGVYRSVTGFIGRTLSAVLADRPINVKDYGAVSDQSITDAANTAAIQAAADACIEGDTLWFPPVAEAVAGDAGHGGYYTSSGITVGGGVDVRMDAPILDNSAADSTVIALTISDGTQEQHGGDHKLWVRKVTQSDWTTTNIGIRISDQMAARIFVVEADQFTIGFQMYAQGTTAQYYNNVTLGSLEHCMIPLDLNNDNTQANNENNFYSGHFRTTLGTNPTVDRWGVRITSSGTFINQKNNFYKPSFQLGFGGGFTSVPILIEHGQTNNFYDCRHETNSGQIADIQNASKWNLIEIGYQGNNDADTTISDTSTDGDDRSTQNLVLSSGGEQTPSAKENQLLIPVYDSGKLTDKITYVDGGTNIHIPNVSFFHTSPALRYMTPHWKTSVAPTNVVGYYTPGSNSGIGIQIDTRICKKLLFRRNNADGFSGRMNIIPFGSDGAPIIDTSAPSPHRVIVRDWSFNLITTGADNVGNRYAQGSDADGDIYIEVDSTVDKINIMMVNGTANLRLYGFSVYAVNAQIPANVNAIAMTGYDEVIEGARLIDGTTPTAGTYELGALLFDKTAAASTAAGQVCVTSGTFSAATDATGDTVNTSAVITGMTDTSDFNVGDFVTVSGGFPASGSPLGESIYKILGITADSVTLDTVATSTVANVTVATVNPTFKAMASHAA